MRGLTARIKTQKSATLKLSRVYKLWTLLSKLPIKNNHNKLYAIEIRILQHLSRLYTLWTVWLKWQKTDAEFFRSARGKEC